ncbi:MGMT family protein [Candidatus Woesearchaeota archaeon]|nr:MGMT family protein [Candidatus Woesearchaeota archaeon]
MTDFQKRVYFLCKKIPKGRVSTYGEISKRLGRGIIGSRAIGNALNKNPYSPVVPCHRVVKSDGSLGGFAKGGRKKIDLLRKEGICVSKGKIIGFNKKIFKL